MFFTGRNAGVKPSPRVDACSGVDLGNRCGQEGPPRSPAQGSGPGVSAGLTRELGQKQSGGHISASSCSQPRWQLHPESVCEAGPRVTPGIRPLEPFQMALLYPLAVVSYARADQNTRGGCINFLWQPSQSPTSSAAYPTQTYCLPVQPRSLWAKTMVSAGCLPSGDLFWLPSGIF